MKNLVSTILLLCLAGGLFAQAIQDSPRTAPPTGSQQSLSQSAVLQGELPLRRISLFSSGVGYFEHAGTLAGSAEVKLPFKAASVNDALKSLVLNDPDAGSPSVSYPSEQTLLQTLRSLKIDLSNDPDTAAILDSLRGAEIEIAAPNPITGRITGVEYRLAPGETGAQEPWVSLFTSQGLRAVSLREINSLAFKDPQINADLTRALDLIMASRNSGSRDLSVSLPGSGSRRVTISYVIPSPVWKVSYRLDLGNAGSGGTSSGSAASAGSVASTGSAASAGNPLSTRFQGWAIVDNDGDTDWNEVELSLVAGRPVSFIQNLYPPYYLSRPTLPLAIAGTAQAQTWDSGYAAEESAPANLESNLLMRDMSTKSARQSDMMEAAVPRPAAPSAGLGSVAAAAATGQAAGDQFEFTIKKPVTLNRRMSAMLPLVDGSMDVKKLLIFSGAGAPGRNVHPNLGAEISNTTGMKLPAGPITVYDGGTYAGDALVEFLNDGEKRLISWGEDLSVTGTATASSARTLSAVSISGGLMTISRKQGYEKKYTLNNVSAEKKTLIVEHPITSGATLTEPVAFTGQTPTVYRFTRELPAKGELELLVREEIPLYERISLLPLRLDALVSYAANQEIPPSVRTSLLQAAELKRKADDASKARTETEGRRTFLVSEQDRIRRNLEAAGNNTQQGQEYLKRMASLDADIDAQSSRIDDATKAAEAAQKAYEDYLNGLEL
ncbi:hypothetical protein AGMMS49546_26860 [Spirochaetia bacterium]|nr:hypothetical protein AGMMS49546_26860 [Spirochaetia bacterium]